MTQSKCLNCGADLTHIDGRRPKKFCNDSCRVSFSRKKKKGSVIILIKDENGRFTCDGLPCSLIFEDQKKSSDEVLLKKPEERSGQMAEGVDKYAVINEAEVLLLQLENELAGITGTSSIARDRKKFLEAKIKKLRK